MLKKKYKSMLIALLIVTLLCSGCGTISNLQRNDGAYSDMESKMEEIDEIVDQFYLDEKDEDEVESFIYKGMMAGLGDPYSTYYTKEEYKELVESTSGVYCGIGVSVTQDTKTGDIIIVTPFKTGPAYDQGVQAGDVITKVEGEDVEGQEINSVVAKMKGEEHTKVKITVYRASTKKFLDFEIERREIEIPSVDYKMLDNHMGYIEVSSFDEVTSKQFEKAIKNLEKQGMEGLIVDLRNNPGGLINVVVDMCDVIIKKGTVVYTEDKNKKRTNFDAKSSDEFSKPMVVLVNENSASAAEIFTGCMRDYKKATIVGTNTYGKGVVQRIFQLKDGSAIKLTIASYFTPNGDNIHKVGIKPDVEVELDEKLATKAVLEPEEDNQLQKAIEVLKEKMK